MTLNIRFGELECGTKTFLNIKSKHRFENKLPSPDSFLLRKDIVAK
jgi:hypothetical protein